MGTIAQTIKAASGIPCPTCQAGIGQPCNWGGGVDMAGYPHAARQRPWIKEIE